MYWCNYAIVLSLPVSRGSDRPSLFHACARMHMLASLSQVFGDLAATCDEALSLAGITKDQVGVGVDVDADVDVGVGVSVSVSVGVMWVWSWRWRVRVSAHVSGGCYARTYADARAHMQPP